MYSALFQTRNARRNQESYEIFWAMNDIARSNNDIKTYISKVA
jgi:hypothetical protein